MSPTGHSERKLAEKLIILNDRGVGMLTRLYNIKKACGDPKSKPSFLTDKNYESSIKNIVKKFPVADGKAIQPLRSIQHDIIKSLSLYYYTFVDLLDFKDHVSELFTIMDVMQVHLDITLNFELTRNYLDLISTFVSLMILISKVDDRKAILGLFNVASTMVDEQSDPSFPRLCTMIMDYDSPLKKLSEDFLLHSKVLTSALDSLVQIYYTRNVSAEQWRSECKLNILASTGMLLNPVQSDNMFCDYLSMDTMEKWIIFGLTLCPQNLQHEPFNVLWVKALESSWVTTLFRDEIIHTHSYIWSYFDTIKGFSKRVTEVKDCYNNAIQKARYIHRERRKFMRSTLKELGHILTDQPGLLGPKALMVFTGICYARDEVLWLLRHSVNPPQIKGKGKAIDDLVDRQLPELLFHMEELIELVRKYSAVIQRYYIQYLSGLDTFTLKEMIQNLQVCPEDIYVILSSLCDTISNLSVKQLETDELFDFTEIRLNLFRLQTFMATSKSPLHIQVHKDLGKFLDLVQFHTKMVDFLDTVTNETSDLSVYCFYSKLFDEQFHMCLELPAQNRYITAFLLICNHFKNCTHELCPEERHHIRDRSISVVNKFLDELSKETKHVIAAICDEHCKMNQKLLPKASTASYLQQLDKIAEGKIKKKEKSRKEKKGKKVNIEIEKPGKESYRKTRENLTVMDKLHMALTELCFGINYCSNIHVWDYTFTPREYLHQHLERRFARDLVRMVMHSPDTNEIAKPSELLDSIKGYISVLQTVENYVDIDVVVLMNKCLLQQTQPVDSDGNETIASLYTQWYSEVLLRRTTEGNVCFSMNRRSFVSLTTDSGMPFSIEEYSDINELKALSKLLGPYGMKLLNDTLVWHIASQVEELKKIAESNKDVLVALRKHFNKPEVMKEQFLKLTNVDEILHRMITAGIILSFRQLAQSSLNDILEQKVPFLLSSVIDIKSHYLNEDPLNIISEMMSAVGLASKVDSNLVNALKSQIHDEDYLLVCLLMVFVAVSIPELAKLEGSFYRSSLGGHVNNIHCMAISINIIFGALFTLCERNDIEDRMKEFLALASSRLLNLGQETNKETIKNRESVYLLLDQIVQDSPFLSMDLLESCFPYALIRNAYNGVYKQEQSLV